MAAKAKQEHCKLRVQKVKFIDMKIPVDVRFSIISLMNHHLPRSNIRQTPLSVLSKPLKQICFQGL